MIKNKKILVVVPARGGSKGIKLKNIREIAGIPLIGHAANCISNIKCGFCENDYNQGICMEGNSEGPLDKLKYGDLCKVGKNYFYGNNIENFENQKYCNINGTCTKMEGENCGVNVLNGQYNSIFNSLEECTNDSLVCEKYNKSNRSKEENKTECLKDVKCGYCNNNDKCVIGTAEGPNNMELIGNNKLLINGARME